MQDIICSYLQNHINIELVDLIDFSPVPKGQKGDKALTFFRLARHTNTNPDEWIEKVQNILKQSPDIEDLLVSGKYLNVSFRNESFFRSVFATELSFSHTQKNIVLEFSGPNTNKPLHLGHMRNHALGISLSCILEAVGATVHRVNIINDRGVHICKSLLAYQLFGNGETPESVSKKPDHFVGDYYVRFEQESKEDETLKNKVQEVLQQWEEGDESTRALWKKMNEWTLAGHAQTYTRQGVQFEKVYKESETYLQGKTIAEEGVQKEVFQRRDDGAIVIDLTDAKLDEKVVLRADGTSIYLTQDLAVAVQRDTDFHHPDEMIYIVADEQNYHFQVLFLCLDRLGVLDTDRLFHLGYGMVHLPTGRMKSREGTVVDADNLMDELSDNAFEKVRERNPELSESEARAIAESIMNAGWKFYLLSCGPKKSITFDPEASLAFEGATGPYLQYAGVRIKSLLRKSSVSLSDGFHMDSLGSEEKELGIKILEWKEVLFKAAHHKNPTYIATYLLELAQVWSRYYAETPILNASDQKIVIARLSLAQKTLSVLEHGLRLLGISVPEKM